MLTREQFAAAKKRRFKDITIPAEFPTPELAGQTIRCWSMTAGQQSELQARLIDLKTGNAIDQRIREIKAHKFVACVGDEAGNPLFAPIDIPEILQYDASIVDEVVGVSDKLNSLFAPTAEDISKNLPLIQTASSS